MPLNLERVKQKLAEFENKDNLKERLVKQYMTFGYQIKPGDIFYKTSIGDEDVWGLKVGEITHSCHIDTTEIVVLFFVDRKPDVISVSDNWLIDSITV